MPLCWGDCEWYRSPRTGADGRQSLDECIKVFTQLAEKVLETDQVIHGYLPAGDDGFRFDYRLLEKAVQQVVKAKLCDEDVAMFDSRQDSEKCPTFVVASSAIAIDGPPQLLRSYDSGGFNVTSKCSIWEAAMATTALPLFFKPVNIELEHRSLQFVGGGLAYRNPAELALDEAYCLWPRGRPQSHQHWNREARPGPTGQRGRSN